jgi:hypothetical protein
MIIQLPNFLIVGSAKCGTTAVADCLAEHPEVYISPMKEPKFFSSQFVNFPMNGRGDDFVESFTIKKFEEYVKLFKRVKDEKAIGEASVENLYYYDRVIPEIKRWLGDVKILIILRDPVERAFSAYKSHTRDMREFLSFEQALEMEEHRRRNNYEYLWNYMDLGFYYEQVRAYLKAFKDVRVLLYNDLCRNPRSFYRGIFRFLDVDPSFIPSNKGPLNSSGVPINAFYRFLFRATPLKGALYKFLTLRGMADGPLQRVIEQFRRDKLRPLHMKPNTREYLKKIYAADVYKLQKLIKRDLSHWINKRHIVDNERVITDRSLAV